MLNDDPATPLIKSPPSLDMLSVEELEARIEGLKAEIVACETMLVAKRRHRDAADAFFKSSSS
ncbi:MAG: DUF1192 domain-containing protein [Caulobacterales bacterium]|jgi:uncharacterized small protein (DUF1192 family)